MSIARPLFWVLSGVVTGIAFALSCGDNLIAKATADAANTPAVAPVCDCPAAEPPLANRFVVFDVLIDLDGNSEDAVAVLCPPGARPISGSCTVDGPLSDRNVILKESGFGKSAFSDDTTWRCSFRNNEPMSLLFRVGVLCLKPAP